MKLFNLSEKNFIALKQKNFIDEINSFFMDSYWSKTGTCVKLMRTVFKKWRNWRSFFYLRHYCAKKISRRSRYNSGTYWQDTGIAKWNLLYRNAEPQRRAAKHLGHMVYRETSLQVQLCLLQHLIRRNWIHGVQEYQNRFTHQRRRRMKIEH